ncbi:MAG: hydrolase [Alphaproteobacteria bacterium]|jgi:nicotinamidase-related amidase|nr:hydrolase [Alphaproteobacteria bacterium]
MLMSAARSGLVIVDLQERLQPAINGGDEITKQAGILLDGAAALDIPALVTEQYPRGLGPTIPEIKQKCGNSTEIFSKLTFSAGKNADVTKHVDNWRKSGRNQAIICGTETHVCVLQTVADLMAQGSDVYLVTDACGSRTAANRDAAISRMAAMGATCVTTEMVIFEWLEVAGTDEFKALSKLIK